MGKKKIKESGTASWLYKRQLRIRCLGAFLISKLISHSCMQQIDWEDESLVLQRPQIIFQLQADCNYFHLRSREHDKWKLYTIITRIPCVRKSSWVYLWVMMISRVSQVSTFGWRVYGVTCDIKAYCNPQIWRILTSLLKLSTSRNHLPKENIVRGVQQTWSSSSTVGWKGKCKRS